MNRKQLYKYLSFSLLALIAIVLAAATIVEKLYGTQFAHQAIYTSPAMIILWGVMAHLALFYILRTEMRKQVAVFALHISLLVIIVGAFTTHKYGRQGVMHLREDEKVEYFMLESGDSIQLPFAVTLRQFELQYHQGTFAPMDYISHLEVAEHNSTTECSVSMNNILTHRGFRLYQSGYDEDCRGVNLAVSHDPYGIAITYTGYIALLLSMIAFFFSKRTHFRSLLRELKHKRATLMLLMTLGACKLIAAELPQTLPATTAEAFCRMSVYYNDRICPLQSVAIDFTSKLCGKSSYRGLTAEQVLTGWFFYYDDWKHEPMIKIKGGETRALLGIDGKYAALTDFTSFDGYKLDAALRSDNSTIRRNAAAANEKFNLVSMLCTASLLKIYPYRDSDNTVVWYSLSSTLPASMPYEQWLFIHNSMNLVAQSVAMRDFDSAERLVYKICKYQQKEAAESMPAAGRLTAERLYNSTNYNRPLSMATMTVGILLFFVLLALFVTRRDCPRYINFAVQAVLILLLVYTTLRIAFRWYISGHIPLSNGFETMQFMAFATLVVTLLFGRKIKLIYAFGLIVYGAAMLVAMMGESSAKITQLMPVLHSPLLSAHVVVIMIAYTLFAFNALIGVSAVILNAARKDLSPQIDYLTLLSRTILYPALFLLTVGIFIGAVWANISWGRYWAWDPKETWALITMLIYSFALHTSSISWFRRPLHYHSYMIVAFLAVLITYFGVNFILGGMHSYA